MRGELTVGELPHPWTQAETTGLQFRLGLPYQLDCILAVTTNFFFDNPKVLFGKTLRLVP